MLWRQRARTEDFGVFDGCVFRGHRGCDVWAHDRIHQPGQLHVPRVHNDPGHGGDRRSRKYPRRRGRRGRACGLAGTISRVRGPTVADIRPGTGPANDQPTTGYLPEGSYAPWPTSWCGLYSTEAVRMSEVLLQTDGLTMDFGGIRAVNDLSISVAHGEIVAVIGPNGSGKTTLFNLIMHLYHWTAGKILFGFPAQDLASLATHRINALGIARTFQTIRLFPKLTVLENVLVGMHSGLHGGLLAAVIRGSQVREQERRAEVEARELLSLFGERLIGMYDEPAEALSYANRRRLEIARALASKPKLLLLDEPAAGMNPTETREAMEDIRRIRSSGCSILVIEHDMGLVEGLADRVIAMDHGTKIAEGSFQQVRSHPEVIRAYLGSGAYAESVATESAPDRKEMS